MAWAASQTLTSRAPAPHHFQLSASRKKLAVAIKPSFRPHHRHREPRELSQADREGNPDECDDVRRQFSRMPLHAALVAARPGGNAVLRRPPRASLGSRQRARSRVDSPLDRKAGVCARGITGAYISTLKEPSAPLRRASPETVASVVWACEVGPFFIMTPACRAYPGGLPILPARPQRRPIHWISGGYRCSVATFRRQHPSHRGLVPLTATRGP